MTGTCLFGSQERLDSRCLVSDRLGLRPKMIEAARLNAESISLGDEAFIHIQELVKSGQRGPVGVALGHNAGKVPRPFERIQELVHHDWGQRVVVFQDPVHFVGHRTHEFDMRVYEFFVLEPVASSQTARQNKTQQDADSNQPLGGERPGLTIRKPAA